MSFTEKLSNDCTFVLIDTYTKDGLTINTFTPYIDNKQREKVDIKIRQRIEELIRETK